MTGRFSNGTVVGFGEILLRLTAPGHRRFWQAESFDAHYGGSEANAAVSLANYGTPAAFVTRLPDNALGQAAIDRLRARGVDTRHIVRGGDRMGLYFVERGAGARGQGIIYDRAGSAIADAAADTFDWERIFAELDAGWFHFSGITPALGEGCAALCLSACRAARQRGMTVSCDLNYREQLWPRARAGQVMDGLCRLADVCIAYEDEPGDLFGIRAPEGVPRTEGAAHIARTLRERFGFAVAAVTVSRSYSAMERDWTAVLADGSGCYAGGYYRFEAVDRIGGGDAFSGALIHALLSGMPAQQAVAFATAAGCLKYTVEGDMNLATRAEVAALADRPTA